jgi:hypothetical protein
MLPHAGGPDAVRSSNDWKNGRRIFQRLEVAAVALALAAAGCRTPPRAPSPPAAIPGAEAAVGARFTAPCPAAERRALIGPHAPDAPVAISLRMLAALQEPDGSWPSAAPVRATALAVLALRCAGGADEAASRGSNWLTARQLASGGWPGAATDDAAVDEALALWAMAEEVIAGRGGSYAEALARGMEHALAQQAPSGGWGLSAAGRPGTLATVLQVIALERTWCAGIVRERLPRAMAMAARFLASSQNPDGTVGLRGPGLVSWASTAEAALGLDLLGLDASDIRLRAIHAMARPASGGRTPCAYPLLEALLCHTALARQQGVPWERWVADIGPELATRGRGGLWSAPANEAIYGGGYATAAAAFILGSRGAKNPAVAWGGPPPALWTVGREGHVAALIAPSTAIAPWEPCAYEPAQLAAMRACRRLVLAADTWRLQVAFERAAGGQAALRALHAAPTWAVALTRASDALTPFGATDALERFGIDTLRFGVAEELIPAEDAAGALSGMPEAAQADLLSVVQDTDLPAIARELHEAWRAGDFATPDRRLRERLASDARVARLWDAHLAPLRKQLAARLAARLGGGDLPVLVVLDAGWILGPGSVLEELRAAGFEVGSMERWEDRP